MKPKEEKGCEYIAVSRCAECQGCCDAEADIAGFICGYALIKAIKEQKVVEKAVHWLKIYRISENLLNDAAKYFRMYPVDNLLPYMTFPQADGSFELLSTSNGLCAFLGPKGCVLAEIKPFACAIFPYYLYKLQLHFNYCCPEADQVENDLPIREKCGKLATQFVIDADHTKEKYFTELQAIKQKYNIPVVEYKAYYNC